MSKNIPANACFKCNKGKLVLHEKILWKCDNCGFEVHVKQKEYIEQWCIKCPEWAYDKPRILLADCGNTTYPCPINNYVKENHPC